MDKTTSEHMEDSRKMRTEKGFGLLSPYCPSPLRYSIQLLQTKHHQIPTPPLLPLALSVSVASPNCVSQKSKSHSRPLTLSYSTQPSVIKSCEFHLHDMSHTHPFFSIPTEIPKVGTIVGSIFKLVVQLLMELLFCETHFVKLLV